MGYTPFDDRAFDLEEGQADRRLPILGAFEDQVVERVTDLRVLPGVGIGKVVRRGVVLRVVLSTSKECVSIWRA